jgi:hypothetical protein
VNLRQTPTAGPAPWGGACRRSCEVPAIVEAQVAGLVEIPVGFVNICTDESGDAWDAFEEAAADALDAEDSDEFFRRIMSGLSQVAGGVGGAASRVRRVAQTTARRAGQAQRITRRAARARSPVGYLVQRLGQYLNEGFDEFDALEDLADLYAEEELDEALPVLAGVAARALVRPLVRRATGQIGLGVRRQIVRSAGQAARTLARRVGPRSVRALPQIVRSIGRSAARSRMPPAAIGPAIRRVASRVVQRPGLIRRMAAPSQRRIGMGARIITTDGGRIPRRLVLRGPVEITIVSR